MELGDYVATAQDIEAAKEWLESHAAYETEDIVSQVREFAETSFVGEKLFFCPVPG